MSKSRGREVEPRDRAFGKRVADLRRARGLTQQQLAALLSNRTSGWMSQVERGIQPVRRMDVLQEIAAALGVSAQTLNPDAPLPAPAAEPVPVLSNDLDAAREVIAGHPALNALLGTEPAAPVDLEALTAQVDEMWEQTHQAAHPVVSDMVTELIPKLEQAVRTVAEQDRPQAYGLLSNAYQALAAAFARQGDARAAWVAADRAITTAELAGDALLVCAGVFRMVHAFVRLGDKQEAERAARTAIQALEQRGSLPPEGLSVLGSLHLAKALVHARQSQRAEAREEIGKARRVAEQLGEDRNDYHLEFGPTNVAIQAVSTAVELGDAGEAIDVAQTIDAEDLSPERQGRLLMDLGRAYAQRRQTSDAVDCLLRAERLSPDLVQNHAAVRAAVKEMVLVSGPNVPTDLMDLADRTNAME
ncbi:helix-turn-helix domain-containing protein [Streptomyces mexicanus]|uniref:helix-turn-helix domain-containing protein n=1 Tax=Streptomyces mexicanus TaxID=178566 RepID=UPI00364AAEF3